MVNALLIVVAGLVLLTLSADQLVRAAVGITRLLGVSPVLIGAVVVGLGTSLPEMTVSVSAAAGGSLGLAVGNVVGSNIANVTLVIGVTAIVAPLVASTTILRREGVLMLVAVFVLALFLWDLALSALEGIVLLVGMAVALTLLVYWAREANDSAGDDLSNRPLWAQAVVAVVSMAVLISGAQLLVNGAEDLAVELGLSATLIGLLLVAVGTSLPELATSMAAARQGQAELVVGNVLGSNLFNSLVVAGAAAVAGPGPIDDPLVRPSAVVMVVTAVAAGVVSFTGGRVVRWEGLALLAGFIVYSVFSVAL